MLANAIVVAHISSYKPRPAKVINIEILSAPPTPMKSWKCFFRALNVAGDRKSEDEDTYCVEFLI